MKKWNSFKNLKLLITKRLYKSEWFWMIDTLFKFIKLALYWQILYTHAFMIKHECQKKIVHSNQVFLYTFKGFGSKT